MSLSLISGYIISPNTVSIKFNRTIQISTLLDENFELYKNAGSEVLISSPFRDINGIIHYNAISRSLILYWNTVLESNTNYIIRIKNLKDAAGMPIAQEDISFTSATESATPSSLESVGTVINEVLIEDKSIRVDLDTSYQIIAKNPEFYVKQVSPKNGDFLIPDDDNNGRVVITFNQRPASNYLSNRYFKVQKKLVKKSPTRWENVPVNISIHSWKPDVFLDLPSTDTTPSYYVDDKKYFETGYKYRIIISSEVGV